MIKSIYIFLQSFLLVFSFTLPSIAFAQGNQPDLSQLAKFPQGTYTTSTYIGLPNDYCSFARRDFPTVHIISSQNRVIGGANMNLAAEIINATTTYMFDGKVEVRIREIGSSIDVARITIAEELYLNPGEKRNIVFQWKVPSYVKAGTYEAVPYFTSKEHRWAYGFDMQDNKVGRALLFTIASTQGEVGIESSKITVQGNPYQFNRRPPQVPDDVVEIEFPLINKTDGKKQVAVKWEIYGWNIQSDKWVIDQGAKMVVVEAGKQNKVQVSFTDEKYPHYAIRFHTEYADTKQSTTLHVLRSSIGNAAWNYIDVSAPELQEGVPFTLKSCLRYLPMSGTNQEYTASFRIQDTEGQVIETHTYTPRFPGGRFDDVFTFTPDKDYSNFRIVAEVIGKNGVIEKSEIDIDCTKFSEGGCSQSKTNPIFTFFSNNWIWIIFGIIAIGIIVILFKKMKNKKNVSLTSALIICMMFAWYAFTPESTYAQLEYRDYTARSIHFSYPGFPDPYFSPHAPNPPGYFTDVLRIYNGPIVIYKNTISNLTDGTADIDATYGGAPAYNNDTTDPYDYVMEYSGYQFIPTVNAGDQIRITFTPHLNHSEHLYWGLGEQYFPFNGIGWWSRGWVDIQGGRGQWIYPGQTPVRECRLDNMQAFYSYDPNENNDYYITDAISFNAYFDTVVERPAKNVFDVKNMTCTPVPGLNSPTRNDVTVDCTVDAVDGLAEFTLEWDKTKAYAFQSFDMLVQDPNSDAEYFTACISPTDQVYGGPLRVVDDGGPWADDDMSGYPPELIPSGHISNFVGIPPKRITYKFQIGNISQQGAPTPPVINGPISGLVGDEYQFGFMSTDSEGDLITYEVDWDADGFVDEYVTAPNPDYPVYSYIPWIEDHQSGVEVFSQRSWPEVGSYTFKARAVDTNNKRSTWTSHTINIGAGPDQLRCEVNPSPTAIGENTTWSAFSEQINLTGFSFNWTGDVTGTAKDIVKAFDTTGTKTAQVAASKDGQNYQAMCEVEVGKCYAGESMCPEACGTLTTIQAIGNAPTSGTPNLCALGSNLIDGSLQYLGGSSWQWRCDGSWLITPDTCQASCIAGTFYNESSDLCEPLADGDLCGNINGIQDVSTAGNYFSTTGGVCKPNPSKINYFKATPEMSDTACYAYWDTDMQLMNGFQASCGMSGGIGAVPVDNPLIGGDQSYVLSPGKTYTLNCSITDDTGGSVQTMTSQAKCNRIVKTQER